MLHDVESVFYDNSIHYGTLVVFPAAIGRYIDLSRDKMVNLKIRVQTATYQSAAGSLLYDRRGEQRWLGVDDWPSPAVSLFTKPANREFAADGEIFAASVSIIGLGNSASKTQLASESDDNE